MNGRAQLEKTAAAVEAFNARRRAAPIYYFEPNRKIESFHHSEARVRMTVGGNRSGKTHHLVAEACAHALGFRPWELSRAGMSWDLNKPWVRPADLPDTAIVKDLGGVRIRVPNRGFIVSGQSAKKGIGETIYPKILELLGPEGGPFIRKCYWAQGGVVDKIILKNESEIVVGSDKQKGLSFESTNYGWNCIDEPISRRAFTGIRRGSVDQAAPILMSFTPLGPDAAWIHRDLYRNADGKTVSTHHISIYDNPYLSPEEVEAFAADPAISEVEKQARLYGKFLTLIDVIYSNYDEDIHVVPDFFPPSDHVLAHVIDPHTVRPWAMLWASVDRRGDIFIFREWPETDFTKIRRDARDVSGYVQLIRRLEDRRSAEYRIIDPNYGPRTDQIRGRFIPSLQSELAQYGLVYDSQINDDLTHGESRVRHLLAYDQKAGISSINKPRLYVCESCKNTRNALSFYSAAPASGDSELPDEKKRDPAYKDFADCVRYLAVSTLADVALHDSTYHFWNPPGDSRQEYAELSCYGE